MTTVNPATAEATLSTLPPKQPEDSETSWSDLWAATAEAFPQMMSRVITDEINRDSREAARLRKALKEAAKGRGVPLRVAMP